MGKFVPKFLISFALVVLGLFFLVPKIYASDQTERTYGDQRTLKLVKFFKKYNSPLSGSAGVYVEAADKYGLDYRLLPAISGVESTFGQNYIAGTYNVYGWGGGEIYFKSWEDGISQISAGLKENYIDRGAKEVEEIAYIYCPPNPVRWAYNVRYFMDQIEKTDTSEVTDLLAANLPLTL